MNRFSMTRMMLALLLCCLIAAYKVLCYTLPLAFLKSMKLRFRFNWFCRYFSQRIRKLNICPVVLPSAPLIRKTRLYNSDPQKPHFYIVKLGFTGVYIIFLLSRNMKNIRVFYLKIFSFWRWKGLLHGIGNLHWFLPTLGIGWNSAQWLPRV